MPRRLASRYSRRGPVELATRAGRLALAVAMTPGRPRRVRRLRGL